MPRPIRLLDAGGIDLVVLDLGLPDIDGLDVLAAARAADVPTVVLTARSGVEERIRGLQQGADDYVTKPFSPTELVLRVQAVLHRLHGGQPPSRLSLLRTRPAAHRRDPARSALSGRLLELTPTEWGLLNTMASAPGRVFSRYELVNRVRGYEFAGYERTIDSHMKNLRRKLATEPGEIIATVLGVGYRLVLAVTGNRAPAFGPLGRRLLAAFTVVALSSVFILTVAALIGTDRGLATAERAGREEAAARTAGAAASGYSAADNWTAADLTAARALAEAAGAQLVIRDATGAMVWPGRAPAGSGPGRGVQSATGTVVTAPITVAGRGVGTVELRFGPAPASGGRTVAWEWIAAAGIAALLLALTVSWYVARRLSAPLVAVTRAARTFAGGDRTVRVGMRAPGELGELASAVDAMADQVVQAEQVRRQLSADVAHELRTPLASMQAGLEELRDGLAAPDPGRLAGLHDQSLRLGRVVEDLAQLSAAESAALSLHRTDVDLADLVATALDGQESRLRSADLLLDRDIRRPVPVHADPDRLHQAVSNLLTNAARYCRPGDHVQVSVDTVDRHARIRVADTGPGIEPADLPHVFERFWRGTNSHPPPAPVSASRWSASSSPHTAAPPLPSRNPAAAAPSPFNSPSGPAAPATRHEPDQPGQTPVPPTEVCRQLWTPGHGV